MEHKGSLSSRKRVIVGISGASGVFLGIRFLQILQSLSLESHLVITKPAEGIIEHETSFSLQEVRSLATHFHSNEELFAPIASGSFLTAGMVVIPCSMKTLAAIANGYSENLLLRAADVCLKERKKLVLVTRESPLNLIHIENMQRVTLAGAIVLPPVLTLYHLPHSMDQIIDHIMGKILDLLGIENEMYERWKGKNSSFK